MKNMTPTDPPNSGPRARLIMTIQVGGVKERLGVWSRNIYRYMYVHHDMAYGSSNSNCKYMYMDNRLLVIQ